MVRYDMIVEVDVDWEIDGWMGQKWYWQSFSITSGICSNLWGKFGGVHPDPVSFRDLESANRCSARSRGCSFVSGAAPAYVQMATGIAG